MDQVKIGQFLRELRRAQKLTQEQLAEELGVSVRTLQRHHKKYQEEALRMEGLKKKEKGKNFWTASERRTQ